MAKPATSYWNPNGDSSNCAACVARYLYDQIVGHRLDDHVSARLDTMSEPREREQPFGRHEEVIIAMSRTESIIKETGLVDGGRAPSGFDARHPAGHFAVMALGGRGGHVVYGFVAENEGRMDLFDPQANVRTHWGAISPPFMATRFTAPP